MQSRIARLVSIIFTLTLMLEAHAGGNHRPETAPATASPTSILRFDLYRGYCMVAHGSAGPMKNLNFLLDTGTRQSTFDARITRKLNLQNERPAGVVLVGGRVSGEMGNISSLELGPIERRGLEISTADLSPFDQLFPVHIDALIGMDVLGNAPFIIDYSHRIIRFGASLSSPLSVPLRIDEGMPVFDAEIDSAPVHLLLDTGASSLVLFSKQKVHETSEETGTGSRPRASSDSEGKQIFVNSLQVGGKQFRGELALVAHNPKPSQIDFDGLMSPAALGITQVSIDLDGGVLAFGR